MDERGIEALVKLGHCVAEVGKDATHEVEPRGRAARVPHRIGERLARDVLHDHHQLVVPTMALDDAGQVRQARAMSLRLEDALVRPSQALGETLAHERPQLGAVLAHEVDALGRLEVTPLEHRVRPVAAVAVERGEVV